MKYLEIRKSIILKKLLLLILKKIGVNPTMTFWNYKNPMLEYILLLMEWRYHFEDTRYINE